MWLCMKWHGAQLYGVHRTHRDGSSFMWHQPCQRCKYTTSVEIEKRAVKSYYSCRFTCERSESARERRTAQYKTILTVACQKSVSRHWGHFSFFAPKDYLNLSFTLIWLICKKNQQLKNYWWEPKARITFCLQTNTSQTSYKEMRLFGNPWWVFSLWYSDCQKAVSWNTLNWQSHFSQKQITQSPTRTTYRETSAESYLLLGAKLSETLERVTLENRIFKYCAAAMGIPDKLKQIRLPEPCSLLLHGHAGVFIPLMRYAPYQHPVRPLL